MPATIDRAEPSSRPVHHRPGRAGRGPGRAWRGRRPAPATSTAPGRWPPPPADRPVHHRPGRQAGPWPGWRRRRPVPATRPRRGAGRRAEQVARSITSPDEQARGPGQGGGGGGRRRRPRPRRALAAALSSRPVHHRPGRAGPGPGRRGGGGGRRRRSRPRRADRPVHHRPGRAGRGPGQGRGGGGRRRRLDRAGALAAAAEQVARSITDLYEQARALARVAEAVAGAGDLDRAEALAPLSRSPGPSPTRTMQAEALAGVAEAAAGAGDLDRAGALAAAAEQVARSITDPSSRPGPWPGWRRRSPAPAISTRWPAPSRSPGPSPTRTCRPGPWPGWRRRRPAPATSTAPRPASPGPSPARYEQAGALARVAEAAAGAGDLDRAEQVARSITRPGHAGPGPGQCCQRCRAGQGPVLHSGCTGGRPVDDSAKGAGPHRPGGPVRLRG